MTSKPVLIRAASVALLVVLFHISPARGDAIVGNIFLSGSQPVIDNSKADQTGQQNVPLTEAAFISSGDILGTYSGDLLGADQQPGGAPFVSSGGIIPAGEEERVSAVSPFAFYPEADFLSVGGESLAGGTNNFGDTDTFIWIDPLDTADTYTFIIDPLSFVGTTTATGVGDVSTLSYSAVGIVEATTDTPGVTFDPTRATLTVTASLSGIFGPTDGNLDVVFTATGVAIDQPFPMPDAGNTALLFLAIGAGLFVASRRRGALRHTGG
jgi:hypothetical protein